MKTKEIEQLIRMSAPVECHIQAHHEGVYFTVEVDHQQQRQRLTGPNGKPLVFRNEESARNLLFRAGVKDVRSHRIMPTMPTVPAKAMYSWLNCASTLHR